MKSCLKRVAERRLFHFPRSDILISPKAPMYKASLKMREEIINTAQDVFGK